MRIPDKVSKDDAITAAWANAMVDCLRSLVMQPSRGIRYNRTSGGTTSEVLFPTPQTPGDRTRHPFKVVQIGSGGGRSFRVIYGTINGVAPDGMSPGDDPAFILETELSVGFIWVGVTASEDSGVTSRFIDIGEELPDDEPAAYETEGTFYRQLASFGSETVSQAVSGSLEFDLCGGVTPNWGPI